MILLAAAIRDPRHVARVLAAIQDAPPTIDTTGEVVDDESPTVVRSPASHDLDYGLTLDEAILRRLCEDRP